MSDKEVFSSHLFDLLNDIDNSDSSDITDAVLRTISAVVHCDIVLFFSVSSDNFMNFDRSYINIPDRPAPDIAMFNLFSPIFLPDIRTKNLKLPRELCAVGGELFVTSDFYTSTNIDTTAHHNFDEALGYATVSLLAMPLYNTRHHLTGVIQLINPRGNSGKIVSFTNETILQTKSLCKLLTLQLELNWQSSAYNRLLESFIEVIAKAIDNKSPYTGEHCQKVPVITRMLASAAINATSGPLKNFEMSDNDWYALHIASLLHDCGKITTPDYIIDKSTKLETPYNRIHEIRTRFEVLRRDAHIAYLQKRLNNTAPQDVLQAEFVEKIKQLTDDFNFIARCNVGDTPLSPADQERINTIAAQTFTRNFSRMEGLSWSEKQLISDVKKASLPQEESILQDRPEQVAHLYNQGELTNLKITSGTINDTERAKINEHVKTTIDMLKDLSFPPELSNIIEYAGAHHERVDGRGYPNALKGDEMSIPAKIMAIADVYEALTARDRPYKTPKKLSQVLSIMRDMKNNGHLDPDLYELFIKSGVYLDYAKNYISPEQIDLINPEEYL